MTRFLLACLFMVCLRSTAQDSTSQLQPPNLDFIKGRWEGTGWSMTEKGKTNSSIVENVYCKIDCSVYIAEGRGMRYDTINMKEVLVHEAYGVMAFDKTKEKWVLRAYKKGMVTESELEFISDKKFIWSLVIPGQGTVRYTTDYSTGKWVENGEFSRDGKSWMPIMSMTLERKE